MTIDSESGLTFGSVKSITTTNSFVTGGNREKGFVNVRLYCILKVFFEMKRIDGRGIGYVVRLVGRS